MHKIDNNTFLKLIKKNRIIENCLIRKQLLDGVFMIYCRIIHVQETATAGDQSLGG